MTKKAARLLPLGVLAAWLLLAPSAHADNWPRFRGPNGTGVANDRDVPVQFDDKTNLLWKVALPGVGHSSPVIWGDRLFLQTALGNAKARQLLCLDAATGKQLWAKDLPGVNTKTKIHKLSSYASATPAVDGERVYLAFWDGIDIHVRSYDLDGNQLWTRNLGYFKSQHGPGASPVAYQGKVYFANDQDDSSTLYCLDGGSGKTVWQKDRPAYRACYSAPFLLEKPGRPAELVVVSTLAVTAYEPNQGAQLWNWAWKHKGKMPLRTTASPAFIDGMLLCCSGDGGGDRYMVGVKLGDNGNTTEPKLVWDNERKDCPYVPTPLVRGDHAYYVNDSGFAGCLDMKTGKKLWQERLPNARAVFASPVLIDGKMYVISEAGDVFVVAAEPTFRLLATSSVNETVRATPAVANNRLYIRGQNHLFCIAKKMSDPTPTPDAVDAPAGELAGIYTVAHKGELLQGSAEIEAVAGRGLAGDRYFLKQGAFSAKEGADRELTLIESEALEALEREFGIVLRPEEARRNLLTRGVRLNDLVGKEFTIGEVRLAGLRLCEPCGRLERLTGKTLIQGLSRRGGLRAQILRGGVLRVGDRLALAPRQAS